MLVVFQEMQMLRVPEIKELVRGQAPREDRLGDSLGLSLGPQARHTKENGFLQHHMIKKGTIHVGCVEGNNLAILFSLINVLPFTECLIKLKAEVHT